MQINRPGLSDGAQVADDCLLRIARPVSTPCPPPPFNVANWLLPDWDDPTKPAYFSATRNVAATDSPPLNIRFDDDAQRMADFEAGSLSARSGPLPNSPRGRRWRDPMLILCKRVGGIANAVDAIIDDIAQRKSFAPALVQISGTPLEDPDAALRRVFDRLAELGISPVALEEINVVSAEEPSPARTLEEELIEMTGRPVVPATVSPPSGVDGEPAESEPKKAPRPRRRTSRQP